VQVGVPNACALAAIWTAIDREMMIIGFHSWVLWTASVWCLPRKRFLSQVLITKRRCTINMLKNNMQEQLLPVGQQLLLLEQLLPLVLHCDGETVTTSAVQYMLQPRCSVPYPLPPFLHFLL
jgi:hypothetical protein